MKKKDYIFLVFGVLKSFMLGFIIFFVLRSLDAVGTDTCILFSVMFPLFQLAAEYMIYSRK